MKKLISIIAMCLLTINIFAQSNKTEILYFKAQLSCCQAKACNALEDDIKQIIATNFDKSIIFKQVALSDKNNKSLIEKYNAKSQSVVLLNQNGSLDISDIVRVYVRSSDKDAFEKDLVAKIKEITK